MTFFLFIFLSFFFFLLPKTYIKIRENIYTRNRTTIRVWDDFTIHGETYKSRNDAENIGQNNRCWSHKSRETDVTVEGSDFLFLHPKILGISLITKSSVPNFSFVWFYFAVVEQTAQASIETRYRTSFSLHNSRLTQTPANPCYAPP